MRVSRDVFDWIKVSCYESTRLTNGTFCTCELPSIALARRTAGSDEAICSRVEEQSPPRGSVAVGQHFAQLHLIARSRRVLQTASIVENLHVGNLNVSDNHRELGCGKVAVGKFRVFS